MGTEEREGGKGERKGGRRQVRWKKGNPGKEVGRILDEIVLWTIVQIQFLVPFKAKIILVFFHCCVNPWVTPS